jgi:nucleotide-binding universal stress UspA family protein
MENKKGSKEKEDNLVTVAIHTYEKAQILKSILESEGIPTVIHGINMIQPILPGNARIRINESDLPRALEIIESVDFSYENLKEKEEEKEPRKEILVPVDFSDYTLKACAFAFSLASSMNCKIKLMNVFYTPFYPAAIPFGDSFSVQAPDQDLLKDIRERAVTDMNNLTKLIKTKIGNGEISNVPYSFILQEGLPEEEIISYSKKMRPLAVVMGTRGQNAREFDIIGSVTAEVIDGCKTPIFAIPESADNKTLNEIQRLVFLTNFQEREIKAFNTLMKFIENRNIKIYFVHLTSKDDFLNEVKLSGFKDYLTKSLSHLEIEYCLIDRSEEGLENTLEKFIEENNIEMIVMSGSRRNIFSRMFNPGIARRMLFHSNTPILVVKGE